MDYRFFIIQLLSVVAWLFLLFSYYRKNTKKILIFQILANITFCMHYFLLGAFSGIFVCGVEALCNLGYYRREKNKYIIYYISIPFRILGGMFVFKNWIDIMPIGASLIDGYVLTKKKNYVVKGAILTFLIWFIYDMKVKSYSGALCDMLIILSNISILKKSMHMKKISPV